MKLLMTLHDDQYAFQGVDHRRDVVRAIVVNEKGKIALHKLYATDMFGFRDYYETPGGGRKEGETLREALERELIEELGAKIKIIAEIGEIVDYYNLIKRENHNYFYLVKVVGHTQKHLEEKEKSLIEKTIWVDIDEAINLYDNMQNVLVGRLVKQRELPIIKLAKEMVNKSH